MTAKEYAAAMALVAALFIATIPDGLAQEATDPLPQGVRARVWTGDAGVLVGRLGGQMETAVIVSEGGIDGRCRELVGESRAAGVIGDDFFAARQREYRQAECPGVIVPGADVTRIDVSRGVQGIGRSLGEVGFYAGVLGGYAAIYSDSEGDWVDTIFVGSAAAFIGGLAGYALGRMLGAPFEREVWQRIR